MSRSKIEIGAWQAAESGPNREGFLSDLYRIWRTLHTQICLGEELEKGAPSKSPYFSFSRKL
jgi:hypothetical protein